jgi:uncharacterized protein YbjT (DUF2867 family)
MKVLLLGATGLVGRNALERALAHSSISAVIAPTRKALPQNEKLSNPVSPQLEALLPEVVTWEVDAVICAMGTTIGKAGSEEAFRQVDYVLPLGFGRLAHQQGAETFALVSAIGASVDSRFFYAKTKGEVERDIQRIGFKSLTVLRPSMIDGKRDEFRFAESVVLRLSHILGPVLPRRFRVNPASKIAEVLVNAVVASEPGCHFRYSDSLAE